MVSICVAGACGRMGRRIMELSILTENTRIAGAFDLSQFAGRDLQLMDSRGMPHQVRLGADAASQLMEADVLIDFTSAESCLGNVGAAYASGLAAVIGTTGLSAAQVEELRVFSSKIPIVYAPNMSMGVNLLFKLAREVAQRLGLEYNAEIVEIHHNQKKDSPSGTAVRLAEQVARGLDWNIQVIPFLDGKGWSGPGRKDKLVCMPFVAVTWSENTRFLLSAVVNELN